MILCGFCYAGYFYKIGSPLGLIRVPGSCDLSYYLLWGLILWIISQSTYNVVYQWAAHINERRTFRDFPTLSLHHMFSFLIMQVQTQQARIIIATKTIRTSRRKLNRRRTIEIYEIPKIIFRAWITDRPSCSDTRLVIQNLTELEEIIIVNYILDRDSRRFFP
jgi:hypothetical protein